MILKLIADMLSPIKKSTIGEEEMIQRVTGVTCIKGLIQPLYRNWGKAKWKSRKYLNWICGEYKH